MIIIKHFNDDALLFHRFLAPWITGVSYFLQCGVRSILAENHATSIFIFSQIASLFSLHIAESLQFETMVLLQNKIKMIEVEYKTRIFSPHNSSWPSGINITEQKINSLKFVCLNTL